MLGGPIATADGQYSGTDYDIGSPTDSGGFTYYVVLADTPCSDGLSKLSTPTTARRFTTLPDGCTRLPQPTARIRFR